jgi:hypothetical protein
MEIAGKSECKFALGRFARLIVENNCVFEIEEFTMEETLGGFKDPQLYEDEAKAIEHLLNAYRTDFDAYQRTQKEIFWTSSGDGCDFNLTHDEICEFRNAIWKLAEKYSKSKPSDKTQAYRFHFCFIPKPS